MPEDRRKQNLVNLTCGDCFKIAVDFGTNVRSQPFRAIPAAEWIVAVTLTVCVMLLLPTRWGARGKSPCVQGLGVANWAWPEIIGL